MSAFYIFLACVGLGSVGLAGAFWLIYRRGEDAEKLRRLKNDSAIQKRQLEEAAKPKPDRATVLDFMRDGKL
jgi:Flp pilus assembly protein TadB